LEKTLPATQEDEGSIDSENMLRGASRGVEVSKEVERLILGMAGDAKFGENQVFVTCLAGIEVVV
jgi:hypothetical protein